MHGSALRQKTTESVKLPSKGKFKQTVRWCFLFLAGATTTLAAKKEKRSDCRPQRCAKKRTKKRTAGRRDGKRTEKEDGIEKSDRFISWSLRLVHSRCPFTTCPPSLSVCQFGITSPPRSRLLKTGIHSATGFRSPGKRCMPVCSIVSQRDCCSFRSSDGHTQNCLSLRIKLRDALHFG